LSELTTIAADRRAFGDDVIAAFTSQIEQRSATAQGVLDAAEKAGRDTLLASEDRAYKGAIRERDSILSLQQSIERRTDARGTVPATQTTTETRTIEVADLSPVLSKEQRCSDFIARRGGALYSNERGASEMRFGAIIRALATGNKRGLSDLERRALEEGSDSAGGYTVPEIVAAQWIDRVRNNMVVMRAGARMVPMTSDTLHIARLAQPGAHTSGSPATSAANWKDENEAISEAELTLERVTLSAKTLPMYLRMSVELSEDSQNIDQIIETEFAQATALELDRAALLGSGISPEPRGIRNQSGVSTGSLGSPTNWDWLCNAAGTLWDDNHEPNAAIYGSSFALTVAKFKDSDTGQPLRRPDALSGITEYRSNQASNLAFVGDFTQLLVGVRTTFRLEVSRVAGEAFERLQIAVRSYLRADIAVAHPEAFNVLS
jgi:HK97 family phage major capsid protein